MACSRRDFMGLAAGALAAATFPACASVAITPVDARDGVVRLSLRDHPRLGQPGGYVKLQPAGHSSPVYVLAVDGEFVAVSPICMHLGCTVNIEGPRLVCPCHGSMYDRRGAVLRGPTERPLRTYPAHVTEEGELVIRVGSAP
jgi:Rieske Fe-S protein